MWAADHVQVKVQVAGDGRSGRPWVTWFIDCATRVICGFSVTDRLPSRESVLVALRDAISREGAHGPFGGLPLVVRVDRGKDFLSRTVGEALGAFAVPVVELPEDNPHLRSTMGALNKAATRKFSVEPSDRTADPCARGGGGPAAGHRPLSLEAFIDLLAGWVMWWNTEHRLCSLGGRTPAASWEADRSPIEDVGAGALHAFTCENDGRVRSLTDKGVHWRERHYVGAWMAGQIGRKVRLRHMPRHESEIEVYDATTGRHLGSAYLSSRSSALQAHAMERARAGGSDRFTRLPQTAEKDRATRYTAAAGGTRSPGGAGPSACVLCRSARRGRGCPC